MAEVILPPEETEPEIPEEQLPEVEEPTEKSKVISVNFSPLNTKQTANLDTRGSFFTTDTDAWIVLNVGDMNEPTGQYSLALMNKQDGSVFQRAGDIVQGVAYYKLLPNEIKHAGSWVGQAIITLANGQTTASRFSFAVSGHILDGKDVREIVIQDFQTLMAQLNDLKDNSTNEFGLLKSEIEDFQTTIQENEDERQATELGRVAAEIMREESYESKVTAAIVEADVVEKVDNRIAELAPEIQKVTAQLAQIVDVNVEEFKLDLETNYDAAISRALDSVENQDSVKLTLPRNKRVKLSNVVTRRKNLSIDAYGTFLTPVTENVNFWTHYGDYFKVFGGILAPETVGIFKGFKISNDQTTPLSSYAHLKDMLINDMYQAIEMNMISGIGGASYRHTLENIRIRDYTIHRQGSFGIKLGGNGSGDASGNDTKLINVFIKGYERNLIVQNSVGTKMIFGGIDGGLIGIELDGGSYFSATQTYIEYNQTAFNFVNTPYRPMLIASTVANYTNFSQGLLLNNEEILEYSPSSPNIRNVKRTFGSDTKTLTRTGIGHGSGLWIDNDKKSLDFMKIGTKFTLAPSEDIDLYEHIPSTKKKIFGDINQTRFSTIDETGVVSFDTLVPMNGITTLPINTSHPDVGRNPILLTNNLVATSIVRLDYGKIGQRMTLIVGDNFTTIVHSSVLKLKTKANKTCALDDTLEFICLANPTDTTCVWIEV